MHLQPAELVAANSAEEEREAIGCELAGEIIRRFGRLRLRVTGTSMLPAVRAGDVLTIRRWLDAGPRPGELVLFGRRGRLWVHRLVREMRAGDEKFWITRGDSLDRDDPAVSEAELFGRVVSIERRGRRLRPVNRRRLTERLLSAALRRSETSLRLFLHFERVRTVRYSSEQRPAGGQPAGGATLRGG